MFRAGRAADIARHRMEAGSVKAAHQVSRRGGPRLGALSMTSEQYYVIAARRDDLRDAKHRS